MKKGFTLAELLCVIIIIGILFTLAIPSITNIINNEKDNISETMQSIILQALELYIQDNSDIYPKTNGNVYCISFNQLITDEYLTEPLQDPTSGNEINTNKYVKVFIENGEYKYSIVDTCTTNN